MHFNLIHLLNPDWCRAMRWSNYALLGEDSLVESPSMDFEQINLNMKSNLPENM